MNQLKLIANFVRTYLQSKRAATASREWLSEKQSQQWRTHQKFLFKHSAFYKLYINKPLCQWPLMDKQRHLKHFDQINTVGLSLKSAMQLAVDAERTRLFNQTQNGLAIGLSSGTSGQRGLFVTSAQERARWAASILAKALPRPIWHRQKIALFLRADNALYQTINGRRLQFQFFDLIRPIETLIASLLSYQPTTLVAPAQVLRELSVRLNKEQLPQLEKIISCAEVLSEQDKKQIEEKWNLSVHQVYQCTEGFLAITCAHGCLHLNEDHLIIEKDWLDDAQTRFCPIVTDLQRRSQPIIRYRLDDILHVKKERCVCGSAMLAIEKIEGRCDDIIWLADSTGVKKPVYPDFITRTILCAEEGIEQYQVKQLAANQLEIAILPNHETTRLKISQAFEQLFHKLDVPAVKIDYCHYPTVTQFQNKQRRIQGLSLGGLS